MQSLTKLYKLTKPRSIYSAHDNDNALHCAYDHLLEEKWHYRIICRSGNSKNASFLLICNSFIF